MGRFFDIVYFRSLFVLSWFFIFAGWGLMLQPIVAPAAIDVGLAPVIVLVGALLVIIGQVVEEIRDDLIWLHLVSSPTDQMDDSALRLLVRMLPGRHHTGWFIGPSEIARVYAEARRRNVKVTKAGERLERATRASAGHSDR